ncbi:hypothetical protein ASPVEDRAFT_33667 [Aspergillus versicolor CBS 583.65]|uniref:Uncharacterized protein n=1 Tax=Aspergillus versicolor CBS 583.65 TaxID=1036611 RepID=A0A1L9Q0Z6_ASPVE|nr:uncharacterized protein ASPVEDRAFT_33667 [Aspergillus versicolor CBS 583.65]OJJ07445.1 hypothetical protein ASPVEDRAFT_33667 [Aspergillus versicolor CBS 583.65]
MARRRKALQLRWCLVIAISAINVAVGFFCNIGFVVILTVMDSLPLGLLALPGQFTYVQFAPVTSTVKLYLELKMVQLISKVVQWSINRVYSSNHRAPLSGSYNPGNYASELVV